VEAGTQVIVGDTMGEMMAFFAASDIAYIGGSLVPTGGHNMLEASALGLPVLSGSHVFNFQEISQLLIDAGGLILVADPQGLAQEVIRLLEDPAAARQLGDKGLGVVNANRGALQRLFQQVEDLLGETGSSATGL
jgi:3-deoxy-D-manno-octulosonic-acid transferase